jgi:hypothetical protein
MTGLLSLAIFLALLLGLGAATGKVLVIVAMLAIMGGVAVLSVPAKWTFWVMIVMSLVVVGPVRYFLHISQLQWLPVLLGSVLYVQSLMVLLSQRKRTRGASVGVPAFVYFLLVFWLTAAFASALGKVTPAEALMGSRYYFLVWGALMIYLVGAIDPATIDRLWKALLLFATFQLPMAVYQYLFVARQRATGEFAGVYGSTPWDAVIGTFPGLDGAGGNSVAMGFFVLSMLLLAVELRREKRLPTWQAAVVAACAIGSIALAEVKGIVLLLPFALALLYRRELARHPARAVAALVGGLLVALALLWVYQKIHYDLRASVSTSESAQRSVIDRLMNNLNPSDYEGGGDSLNRFGNLARWGTEQAATLDFHRTLFGHGIGTTQYGNLGVGRLVAKYGADIGRTSLVILLWETGIVGVLSFSFVLVSGALLSARLAKDVRIPQPHRIYLRVGALIMLLYLLTLPYKNLAVRLTGTQLLLIFLLGQAFYWWRATRSRSAAAAAAMLPDSASATPK